MNRIRELREARHWTVNELAEKVGTSGAQLSRLERGERRLTVDWMQRIAKALGCKPSDLIELAALAEFDSDVEPYVSSDVGTAQTALTSRGISLFRIIDGVLEQIGLATGAIIVVDHSDEAIAKAATGDVVLAEVSSADEDIPTSRLILRQFVAPGLLVTNRRDGNSVIPIRGAEIECRIVGVVIPPPRS